MTKATTRTSSKEIKKDTPQTTPIRRKSERLEKLNMPSPLGRSDKDSSLGVSGKRKKEEQGDITEQKTTMKSKDLKENTSKKLSAVPYRASLLKTHRNKDSLDCYRNLLSFLGSSNDKENTSYCKHDSNGSVEKLKEKLAWFVASERKSDSSKFVEYWVPVKLSNVQLEQYCHTLHTNSAILRSCPKSIDTIEHLRNVLISTRKCCDHPYLVDPCLQKKLTKGLPETEYLDVGVKASGKLQVLDKILSEIKRRGLRVLILFQSIVGYGGMSLGGYLDDVVRQRLGEDSCERVDAGLRTSKKRAAINNFNDKEKGRIVFLLEQRACDQSIKLSSVDIVILYDSDWNPYTDLKALQKITIDSRHEKLPLFRLYSSSTSEEKALIHAKQAMTIDSNVQNLNISTVHALLSWGASDLFNELKEFHDSSEQSLLNLVKELSGLLPQDAGSSSIVVEVKQTGGVYCKDICLPHEMEMQSIEGDLDLPHVFWEELLERKIPKWRYSSSASPSQSSRKRVQCFDGSPKITGSDSDDCAKKRRKLVNQSTSRGEPALVTKLPGQQDLERGEIRATPQSQHCSNEHVTIRATPPSQHCSNKAVGEGSSVLSSLQLHLKDLERTEQDPSEEAVTDRTGSLRVNEPVVMGNILTKPSDNPVKPTFQSIGPLPCNQSEDATIGTLPDMQLQVEDLGISDQGPSKESIADGTGSPGHNGVRVSEVSETIRGQVVQELPMSAPGNPLSEPLLRNSSSHERSFHPSVMQSELRTPTVSPSEPPESNHHNSVFSLAGPLHMLAQPPLLPNSSRHDTSILSPPMQQLEVPTMMNSVPFNQSRTLTGPYVGSGTRASDTRNMTGPLYQDPLCYAIASVQEEMKRIKKLHEERKTRINSEYEREKEEIIRKNRKLHRDVDTAFDQKKKEICRDFSKVLMSRKLAEVFRSKWAGPEGSQQGM